MKVIINGALGKMGKQIISLLEQRENTEFVCGIDIAADGQDEKYVKTPDAFTGNADCIIDFSNHVCTENLLAYAKKRNLPVVIATTGHTEAELEKIGEAAKAIPVFHAGNFSLGIALLCDFAKKAAAFLPGADIEIVEKHHNQKVDAPSGTALMLANAIKEEKENAVFVCGRYGHAKRQENEIGIHSLRIGSCIGEHEVLLSTGTETITLKHEAHTRALFADGAVTAAEFLVRQKAGLYTMQDIVKK